MDVNGSSADDPESIDAVTGSDDQLDLTPRQRSAATGGKRNWLPYAAMGVVLIVGVVVLMNGLSNATTFFYNVDEALAKKEEIGDRRVRIQGHADEIVERSNGVSFRLSFNGESVDVDHSGPVPDLFNDEIPIVIEGNFTEDGFESNNILVKHDETYEEENEDRLKDAEDDITEEASANSTGSA